jgi:hypothetical protein
LKKEANSKMTMDIDPAVNAIIAGWSNPVREAALEVRSLIYDTASKLPQVGILSEMLKWNQPAYLTNQTGAGTTIRMGETRDGTRLGLYVHCQTSLVDTFRSHYSGQLEFEKKRAIILHPELSQTLKPLRHCIALALTYHSSKVT